MDFTGGRDDILIASISVVLASIGYLAKTVYELSRSMLRRRNEWVDGNGKDSGAPLLHAVREIAVDATTRSAASVIHEVRAHVSDQAASIREKLDEHDRGFETAMATLAVTEHKQTLLLEQQARLLERIMDKMEKR